MNFDETDNNETVDFSDMPPLEETAQQEDDPNAQGNHGDPLMHPTPPNTPRQDDAASNQTRGADTDSVNPNAHTSYLQALTNSSTDNGNQPNEESQGNEWTTVQGKKQSNAKRNNSPKSAQAIESQNVKRTKGDDSSGSLCSMMSPCMSKRTHSEDSQDSVTETTEHPPKASTPVSANTRRGRQQRQQQDVPVPPLPNPSSGRGNPRRNVNNNRRRRNNNNTNDARNSNQSQHFGRAKHD